MSLSESLEKVKYILSSVTKKITNGAKRREAAAEIAKAYGSGGQTFAANELRMSRNTVRKGTQEIDSGEKIEDRFDLRGRKKATELLPELENQIKTILDSQSQADPKFQTDRLYTNMSVGEIRKQLIMQYGYTDEVLPTERTLCTIVNDMRYTVKTVKKTEPKEKTNETELIFENINRLHEIASVDDNTIRLSTDTKDKVKVGDYSRGGTSRVNVKANDHDFCDEHLVPFGIMDVKGKTVDVFLSETKVTADFQVDMLYAYWERNGYAGSGKKLLLNLDNGPENNSRRTQFVKRMIEFSIDNDTEVTLAYYPPYHSKYNPIERAWGVLEKHWGGELLDSKETIVKYIETATYDHNYMKAEIIDAVYETKVKVNKKSMNIYEKALERIAGLEDYFVRISPKKCIEVLPYTFCFC